MVSEVYFSHPLLDFHITWHRYGYKMCLYVKVNPTDQDQIKYLFVKLVSGAQLQHQSLDFHIAWDKCSPYLEDVSHIFSRSVYSRSHAKVKYT